MDMDMDDDDDREGEWRHEYDCERDCIDDYRYYTTGTHKHKHGGDNSSDRKSRTGWDPIAFLKRAASNNKRFYTWLMVGVLLLMVLFLVLLMVVFSELGKWTTPIAATTSDEPSPSPLPTETATETETASTTLASPWW
mmetsp:Transcript_15581/g.32329  ORF Transcript_15581/g.32329 Transcript_15581/m.32329 type:complete len:138 (+) Transcript_15581:3-416(+)